MEGITIYYLNADTMSNKMDLLSQRAADRRPDIIAINEVKPKHYRFKPFAAEYSLPDSAGYAFIPNNLESDTGRGQVIMHKRSLDAKQVYLNSKFQEHSLLEVNLQNDEKLLFALIYRSDSGSNDNNNLLLELLSVMCDNRNYQHLLVVGDFNYPAIDWLAETSRNGEQLLFVEHISGLGLHQQVLQCTRSRGQQTPSLLDLVFSNAEGNCQITRDAPLGKSDHCCHRTDFQRLLNWRKNI